jgi:hypothetical protein
VQTQHFPSSDFNRFATIFQITRLLIQDDKEPRSLLLGLFIGRVPIGILAIRVIFLQEWLFETLKQCMIILEASRSNEASLAEGHSSASRVP